MQHRILVSNLGYSRDIDGSLLPHFLRGARHVCTPIEIQKYSLDAYLKIIEEFKPDICCMIEVDTGSFSSAWFNQFEYICTPDYPIRDASSKYATSSWLSQLPPTRGKSNGFMAKRHYPFQRLYLSRGSKRLIYQIRLEEGLTLLFTHLSLRLAVRNHQIKELRELADKEQGDVLIAGDFNIFAGLDELQVFLSDGHYKLLNKPEEGTFVLFGKHYLLDICIASSTTAEKTSLQIIDQPFSDHDALLITIDE